jgi:dynein heavy chain
MKEPGKTININDVEETVTFGIIEGSPLETLLKLMKNDFAPDILNKKLQWPDSLQKEFLSHMHKFLASLTETTFRMKGSTVLYVPLERIDNVKEARKQKDLCVRLDGKDFICS